MLARLSDLFSQVDETLLATVRELDAMPQRGDAEYWGPWRTQFGKPPTWPTGSGQRVFLYLKPSKALPMVLAEVARRGLPTIAYAGSLNQQLMDRSRAPNIKFETEPVDMESVAEQCDLAVLNATHGTVLQMLLAGKPLLLFPLFLEQRITAERCLSLGAGLMLDAQGTSAVPRAFESLLSEDRFAEAAQQFAARYADFDSKKTLERATARLLALIDSSGA
jgi:hypothetical protein